MTDITTALKALTDSLRDTLDFVERHSNRWDGINGKHPQEIVEAARAALAAPAPALDAPADELLEAAIDASDGAWHDGEFRIEGRALMNLLRDAAARASQPTPAQDAAATVPENVWAEYEDAVRDLHDGVNVHGALGRMVALREQIVALAAPQVAPTAAQPVVTPEMVAAYLRANDAYWKATDELPQHPAKWRNGNPQEATLVSLEAALRAAPTTALVPLTDERVNELWRTTLGGPHQARASAHALARAVEAAHDIPAGTTPKEQQ